VLDALGVKILQTLENLQCVHHHDFLILHSTVFEQVGETASLAVLLEDIYSVPMNLQLSEQFRNLSYSLTSMP
jgi:hypothetical protein